MIMKLKFLFVDDLNANNEHEEELNKDNDSKGNKNEKK